MNLILFYVAASILIVATTSTMFTPKADLSTAVTAWIADEALATTNYGDISTWDVSKITDMSSLFDGKSTYNSNIGTWDTRSVTNMWSTFCDAFI